MLGSLFLSSLQCSGSIISGSSSLGSIVPGTDGNLCSSPGQTTQGIVVRDLGGASGGRSAHLAPLYAGDNNTPPRTGTYEALIENTVFWVSGKKVIYTTRQQTTQQQTTQQQTTSLQTTQQQTTQQQTTALQTTQKQTTQQQTTLLYTTQQQTTPIQTTQQQTTANQTTEGQMTGSQTVNPSSHSSSVVIGGKKIN